MIHRHLNRSTIFAFGILLVGIVFSLTPFYSIGYLLIITVTAHYIAYSRVFASYFSRFVASLLVLLGLIMAVGLLTWFIKIPMQPVLVSLVLTAIVLFAPSTTTTPGKLFDKTDWFSLATAIILPIIIVVSYLAPHFTPASLYQMLSNGGDNSSHIQMIEGVTLEDGYYYGTSHNPEVKRVLGNGNSYPMGWHLATSNFFDGFGHNVFSPGKPISIMWWYTAALFLWYIIAGFLIGRVGLWLIALRKRTLPSHLQITSIAIGLLIIQSITIFGSFWLGFADFIGLIAYLVLMAGIILPYTKSDRRQGVNVIVTSIAAAAGIMCWLLPLPAILFILGYYAFQLIKYRSTTRWTLLLAIPVLIVSLTQVGIFVHYSAISGLDQLNADGAVFRNSVLLVLIVVAATIFILSRRPLHDLRNRYLSLIVPFVIMLAAVYAYQSLFSGATVYYYYKLLILLIVYVGLFVPFILVQMTEYICRLADKRLLATYAVAIATISLVLIGSGQSLGVFSEILQRNSVTTYPTATIITNYLASDKLSTTRQITLGQGVNSYFASKVAFLPLNTDCNYTGVHSMATRLDRLTKCANSVPDETIQVLANDKTRDPVTKLHLKNVRIVSIE